MKRMILAALLASSMLAAIPVGAAEVNWRRSATQGGEIFSWSGSEIWENIGVETVATTGWGGQTLPADGDVVVFALPNGDAFPTTVNYDESTSIRFRVLDVKSSPSTPLTLRLDAPYTLSSDFILVQSGGTLALYGGTLLSDDESILTNGHILQTDGTNRISNGLSILSGAYDLVGGVLRASTEWIESAGEFFQAGGTNTAESRLVVDGTFTQNGGNTDTDALYIGESGVGTYFLVGGDLDASIETFGNSSAGFFTQSGGTHTAGTLLIGSQAFGTYTLSGGTLDAFGMEINNGIFNQSGGINSLTTAMIGMSDGFTGRFDLSGGALSANAVFVGNRGPGNFLHTDGTSNVNELTIGANGATGTYRLEGSGHVGTPARLTAGVEYIGASGTGVFDHYGSLDSVHTAGQLYLGYDTGGNGSYNMHGNVLLAAGDVVVGRAGNGSFMQHMGNNSIGPVPIGEASVGTGTLTIGELPGGAGVYSMNPTVGIPELWASTEVIGNRGSGTFTQFGGTNTVAGDLYLGRFAGGIGTYTLSGPSESFNPFGSSPPATVLSAANVYVGSGGTGNFEQTGGTIRVRGDLRVGGLGAGTYDQSGGTLYAANIWIGAGTGTGTFIQSGGSNNVSNVLTVGVNGTYTLSGVDGPGSPASLITAGILNNGTFNFSGGSLSIYRPPSGPPPYPPDPDFTNNGTLNISGTGERYFSSLLINNGTVKTNDTTVIFNGNFINNGAYLSDPSTNIFSNLTVGERGYLVGALGDVFKINGDLIVRSLMDDQWKTSLATLEFSSGIHTLDLSGSTVDFRFGTLQIDDGRNFSVISDESNRNIFADVLRIYDFLGFLSNFQENGTNINYGSLFAFNADGSSFTLTEAELIQFASLGFIQASGTQASVPEPSAMLLLGSGLVGLVGYGRRRFKKY